MTQMFPIHRHQKFKDKLQNLYRLQNHIPKLIEDDRIPEQTWDKFYLKLNVFLHAKNESEFNEKQEIELDKIFAQINAENPQVGKVLLFGVAGAGKTTTINYITYSWGIDKLWADKFDLIFRLKLKLLADPNWARDYTQEQKKQALFTCFVHHCLEAQIDQLNAEEFTFEEIQQVISNEKVLFLYDGHNEIVYDKDFKKLTKEIFKQKYFIMSSRPNSFESQEKNQFERIVENDRFDFEEVSYYIDNCFAVNGQIGTNLKEYLARNSQVRGMCELPINTTLICIIWHDQKSRQSFKSRKDFKVAQLYEEVLIWLGRRFLKKFDKKYENRKSKNIGAGEVLKSDIVEFLKIAAYKSFRCQENLIAAEMLKDKELPGINIEEVNEFGLIRSMNYWGDNLLSLSYEFIHDSFQEYLTALYFEDHLLRDLQMTCNSLAFRRYDMKYLMVLKFLVGVLSGDETSDNDQVIRRRQIAILGFWEAMYCNLDGIVELDLRSKTKLLMHLIVQSRTPVPSFNAIVKLIDETITKDFTRWHDVIIESGYFSQPLKQTLENVLENPSSANLELQIALEVLTGLISKPEIHCDGLFFDRLPNLINQMQQWPIQKFTLVKLAKILDTTIPENIIKSHLEMWIRFLVNVNLNSSVAKLLHKTVRIFPSLAEAVFNFVKQCLDQFKDKEQENKLLFKFLVRLLSNLNEKDLVFKLAQNLLDILATMLKTSCDNYIKCFAVKQMRKIIASAKVEEQILLVNETIDILIDFALPQSDWLIRDFFESEVIRVLKAIHSVSRNAIIGNLTDRLFLKLQDSTATMKCKMTAVNTLVSLVKEIDTDRTLADAIVQSLFAELKRLISSFDDNRNAPLHLDFSFNMADFLSIVPENQLERFSSSTISLLSNMLSKTLLFKKDTDAKAIIVHSLGTCSRHMPAENQSDVLKVLLNPLLMKVNDAPFINRLTQSIKIVIKCLKEKSLKVKYEKEINLVFVTLYNSLVEKPCQTDPKLYAAIQYSSDLLILTQNDFEMIVLTLRALGENVVLNQVKENTLSRLAMNEMIKLALFGYKKFSATVLPRFVIHFVLTQLKEQNVNVGDGIHGLTKLLALVPPDETIEIMSKMIAILIDTINTTNDEDCLLESICCVPEIINCRSSELGINERMLVVSQVLANVIICPRSVPPKHRMISVLHKGHSVTPAESALESLGELFRSKSTACSVNTVQSLVTTITNVFDHILPQYSVETHGCTLAQIIAAVPLSKTLNLLTRNEPWLRNCVFEGIVHKLNSSLLFPDEHESLIDILKLMSSYKNSADEQGKDLYFAACKKLKLITEQLDQVGLNWVLMNLDMSIKYTETAILFKQLYDRFVNGNFDHVQDFETIRNSFVVECVKQGLAINVRKVSEDEIQFELQGSILKLYYNVELLENVQKAFEMKSDPLLQNLFIPLFKNTQRGLKTEAAYDVPSFSLLDGQSGNDKLLLKGRISSTKWLISLLHLSNQKQELPTDTFLLFEKRDYFGYHMIYKWFVQQGKLESIKHSVHPHKIDTTFCQKIFGPMCFTESRPFYYASLFDVGNQQMKQLVDELAEISKEAQGVEPYELFHGFIQRQNDIFSVQLPTQWAEYVPTSVSFSKENLLRLKGCQREFDRLENKSIERADFVQSQFDQQFKSIRDVINNVRISNEGDRNNLLGKISVLENEMKLSKEFKKEFQANFSSFADKLIKCEISIELNNTSVRELGDEVDSLIVQMRL